MKILFNTALRENLVTVRIYDWLEKEMSKLVECKYWGPNRRDYVNIPLDKVIKKLYGDDAPDWVITTPYMHCEHKRWIGYKCPPSEKRSWKIAAFTDDLHANHMLDTNPEGYVEALNKAGFDAILMWYTKLGYAKKPYHKIDSQYYLKNLKAKICYLPKFIDPDDVQPGTKRKDYDVVFLGAVEKFQYPLRYYIWHILPKLAEMNDWKVLLKGKPPGKPYQRRIKALEEKGYIVGDAYTEILGRSKIFIFGNSIYKYPLLKIFEGWGCRTLVMCDMPFGAKRIHMKDGINFVEINQKNWIQKLEYYLNHKEERETITKKGYETVMMHHTVSVRARELLRWLKKNF